MMITFKKIICIAILAMFVPIGACTTSPEPFKYHPDNELQKGPGLFSGEDGAFTIYRVPADSETAKDESQPSE